MNCINETWCPEQPRTILKEMRIEPVEKVFLFVFVSCECQYKCTPMHLYRFTLPLELTKSNSGFS